MDNTGHKVVHRAYIIRGGCNTEGTTEGGVNNNNDVAVDCIKDDDDDNDNNNNTDKERTSPGLNPETRMEWN